MNNQAIGMKIKQLRKEKKILQKKLASDIDKSVETIKKYENGSIEIPLSTLKKIAEALGTNVETLLYSDMQLLLPFVQSYKNTPNHIDYIRNMEDGDKKDKLIELIDFLDVNFDKFNTLYGIDKVATALSIYDAIIYNIDNVSNNTHLIIELDKLVKENNLINSPTD